MKAGFTENEQVYVHDEHGSKIYGILHKNTEHPEVSEWYIHFQDGEKCAVLVDDLVFKSDNP